MSDASPLFSHLSHEQSGFHPIKANEPGKEQTDFYLLAIVLSTRNGQRRPNKEIGKMRHWRGASIGFGRNEASVAAGCAFLALFTLSSEIEEERR